MQPKIPRWWRRLTSGHVLPDGFSIEADPTVARRETLELTPVPCLALLGEAGMGKSYELAALWRDCANRLVCNLGPYRDSIAILDFLHRQEAWQAWRSGAPLALFFDGLDECLIAVPEVVELIISTIANVGIDRLTLRIACRTGAWSQRLEDNLRSLYGEKFEAVELLPLTQKDASVLAARLSQGSVPIRSERLKAVARDDISPLAARPVTLRMLVKLLARAGAPPDSRVELYRRGLQCLLREPDSDRARRMGSVNDDPFALATWLAAAIVLGNHAGIAERIRPDGVGEAQGSLTLQELARVLGKDTGVLTDLLCNSSVFTSVAPSDESGWSRNFEHRSFAEFLTAHWLSDRCLGPAQVLSTIGNSTRVAPQMEEVAAWLAALDETWFTALLSFQPDIIVRGDPAGVPMGRRRQALVAILNASAMGVLQDDTTGWERQLSRLDYPGIEDDLSRAIRAEGMSGPTLFVSRRVAIATAGILLPAIAARDRAGAVRLLDALAATAAAPDQRTDGSNVRNAAGWALRDLVHPADGSEPAFPLDLLEPAVLKLRPLLELDQTADPDRELLGIALLALHPRWLSDAQLVEHLEIPGTRMFGNYWLLFHRHLPEQIADNLALASQLCLRIAHLLDSAEDLSHRHIDAALLRALTDACTRAGPDNPAVAALARLLVAASRHHLHIQFSPELLTEPELRRCVWRAELMHWTVRRWENLVRRLKSLDAAALADEAPEDVPRLAELAQFAAQGLEQLRDACAGWTPQQVATVFRRTRIGEHGSSRFEIAIAWHLNPLLVTPDDLLYSVDLATHEQDPLLREEFLLTAWRLLDIEAESADHVIGEIRTLVAATTGPIRRSLEWQFEYVLDQQRLLTEREGRRKERLATHRGPEDGKSPQERLAELIDEAKVEPVGVFPTLLAALPLKPTDTHWGNPYSGDLAEYPAWVAASPQTRGDIRAVARAFLLAAGPHDESWAGKSEFPSSLLDGCRAFQLLALDDAACPDLGLPTETWEKWALTLLDKLRVLEPRGPSDDLLRRLARQAPRAASRVLELLDAARRHGSDDEVWSVTRIALQVRTPTVEHALVEHARAADLPRWADRAILEAFLNDGNTAMPLLMLSRLDDVAHDRIYRINAILALAQRGLRPTEWPAIWRVLHADDEALFEVLGDLRGGFSQEVRKAFAGLPAANIGQLLDHLLASTTLEPIEGRKLRHRASVVTPEMHAEGARNDLLSLLEARAGPDDVAELERIVASHPSPSLRWRLHHARTTLDRQTWRPLSLKALMQLAPTPPTPDAPANPEPEGPGSVNLLHLAMPGLQDAVNEIHAQIAPDKPIDVMGLDHDTSLLDLRSRLKTRTRTLLIVHVDDDTTRLPYVANKGLAEALERALEPAEDARRIMVVRHGTGDFGCADLLGFPTVWRGRSADLEHFDVGELDFVVNQLRDEIATNVRELSSLLKTGSPTSKMMSGIEDIFRTVGLPQESLIETELQRRILQKIRTSAVVLIEGPMTSGKTIAAMTAVEAYHRELLADSSEPRFINALGHRQQVVDLLSDKGGLHDIVVVDDIHSAPDLIDPLLRYAKSLLDPSSKQISHRRLILIGIATAIQPHLNQAQDIALRLESLVAREASTQDLVQGVFVRGATAANVDFSHATGLAAASRGWPALAQHLALEAARAQRINQVPGIPTRIGTSPRAAFRRVQDRYRANTVRIVESFLSIGKDNLEVRRLAFLLCWWAGFRDTTSVRYTDLPDTYEELKHAWPDLRRLAASNAANGVANWTTSMGLLHDQLIVDDILLAATLPSVEWFQIGVSQQLGVSIDPQGRWSFAEKLGPRRMNVPAPPGPRTAIEPREQAPYALHAHNQASPSPEASPAGANRVSPAPMHRTAGIEKVDFGIITIREDELAAVLQRFPENLRTVSGHRRYRIRSLRVSPTEEYTVAVLRCAEQGNGDAQTAARDLLEDLAPSWIFVVGIAGGVPANEFSLGDVVVSTRIIDFSVEAVLKDHSREYALTGGPLHPEAIKWVADIRSMVEDHELDGWNDEAAIGRGLPPVDVADDKFYGDDDWKKDTREKIKRRFITEQPRSSLVIAGAIASSDRLIKEAEILQVWLKVARQVQAIEMESAGVYRATHSRQIPFLAIRGISDVVGFKRHPDWTDYACHSAAAFTLVFLRALLRAAAIEPRKV